ncbi:hypothetical protein [Vampirovibrio chlorellavorus]|uniref:hypothetical protein n=1 Tax=Vampirovibrio chlorellavorus TaxID=758823 RepID=UPI0026EABAD4|nr:hypothetical protein [Vampirovibrio chlorellavorus]
MPIPDFQLLSRAWARSAYKPDRKAALPPKNADASPSASVDLSTHFSGDTVRFRGSGSEGEATVSRQVVQELKIPYAFKVYRREKDPVRGKISNYLPRTIQPENLASHLRGAKLIALGDLHGSYQKLVETLLATGLATMPPDSVASFREISDAFAQDILTEPRYPTDANPFRRYAISRINRNSLARSERLLQMAAFSQEAIDDITQRQQRYQGYYQQLRSLIQQLRWTGTEGQQLLLIGDVLSDRGALDFLTLDVMDQITRDHPHRLIGLASNHDHAGMQTLIYGMFPVGWRLAASLGRSVLMATDEDSRVRLSLHPEGEAVRVALRTEEAPGSLSDLRQRYRRYVQGSQLVHYGPEYQTLFTHAPVTTTEISQLNDILSQRYLDCAPTPQFDSKSGRACLSDVSFWQTWANRFWQTYAGKAFAENSLKTPVEEMLEGLEPGQGFLWRRDPLKKKDSVPFFNNGVQALVHGHDRGSLDSPFSVHRQLSPFPWKVPYTVINLDQDTRKTFHAVTSHQPCSLYVEF